MSTNKEKKIEQQMTFESAVERLEQIVSLLEHSDLSLEKGVSLYEEGCRLYKYCQDVISNLNVKIEFLDKSLTD